MDSIETTVATEATDSPAVNENSQAPASEKMYSQKEFDDAMAKMKAAVTAKALKPYQDLGDPDELKQLKSAYETKQQEEALKRGEFDKVIAELAQKKDAEIAQRDAVIKEYKIDSPLLEAAARHRSVNPDQVKSLLKGQLRLGENGVVEVVDNTGTVKYKDDGQPMGVDDLVSNFLQTNPHFVSPTPSTTNTQSSVDNDVVGTDLDISSLDMKNPEHRARYAEWKQSRK
jgi:hypothetical protein